MNFIIDYLCYEEDVFNLCCASSHHAAILLLVHIKGAGSRSHIS